MEAACPAVRAPSEMPAAVQVAERQNPGTSGSQKVRGRTLLYVLTLAVSLAAVDAARAVLGSWAGRCCRRGRSVGLVVGARHVLESAAEAVDEVKRVGSGQAGRLIIGFSTAAGSVPKVRDVIRRFSQGAPDVDVRVRGQHERLTRAPECPFRGADPAAG